jgi:ketosteroid isomerase-like protein
MITTGDIMQLEERRRTAMAAGDAAALEALSHEDLLYVHGSAAVDTKQSWIEAVRSGRTRYRDMQYEAVEVRMLEHAALLTGKATFQVEVGGRPRTLRMRFLNLWSETPAGWKFVAWQATPLPE